MAETSAPGTAGTATGGIAPPKITADPLQLAEPEERTAQDLVVAQAAAVREQWGDLLTAIGRMPRAEWPPRECREWEQPTPRAPPPSAACRSFSATTRRARVERALGRDGQPTALDRQCRYCRGPLTAYTRAAPVIPRAAPVMVRKTGRSSRCP